MKVLILSTYEKAGGAAIAAGRLLRALNNNGVEAKMLCMKGKHPWSFLMERLTILVLSGFKRKNLWAKDIALFGQDITHTEEYREADVIHLHWINQGFITLKAIRKFIDDGKKIVWTMHDAWNSMGAYHLKIQQKDDLLERFTFRRKQELYKDRLISFVACSEWLRSEVLASELMKEQNVVTIPNPLDTKLFHPQSHENKRRVLFVAQFVNNPMKGIQYLEEAERIINGSGNKNIEIVALGRDIPYISDIRKMAELYASFDAFVLPSLSENLPNTIMEAMACGIPCVGFNVGGIPEEIDHKVNGYVAEYKSAEDLARGIEYVLSTESHERLSIAAREKIIRCYSEESVAKKYMDVYSACVRPSEH